MSIKTTIDQKHRELSAQICRLIAKTTAQPVEKIAVSSKLDSSLGIDSMMMIELSVAIEEEFDVLMPDLDAKEAAHVKTVNDLVALVVRKLDEKQAHLDAEKSGQVQR